MSLSDIFAFFCRAYLPWNVVLAAYGLSLYLTGRFWQRNTSPLLRRVGHGVAIHCSLLPPLLPISWILAERFPRAYAALGALILYAVLRYRAKRRALAVGSFGGE